MTGQWSRELRLSLKCIIPRLVTLAWLPTEPTSVNLADVTVWLVNSCINLLRSAASGEGPRASGISAFGTDKELEP